MYFLLSTQPVLDLGGERRERGIQEVQEAKSSLLEACSLVGKTQRPVSWVGQRSGQGLW